MLQKLAQPVLTCWRLGLRPNRCSSLNTDVFQCLLKPFLLVDSRLPGNTEMFLDPYETNIFIPCILRVNNILSYCLQRLAMRSKGLKVMNFLLRT